MNEVMTHITDYESELEYYNPRNTPVVKLFVWVVLMLAMFAVVWVWDRLRN